MRVFLSFLQFITFDRSSKPWRTSTPPCIAFQRFCLSSPASNLCRSDKKKTVNTFVTRLQKKDVRRNACNKASNVRAADFLTNEPHKRPVFERTPSTLQTHRRRHLNASTPPQNASCGHSANQTTPANVMRGVISRQYTERTPKRTPTKCQTHRT